MSLTTLAILPAFVPILAPLLALAKAAASSCSAVSIAFYLWFPRILLQIGSMSVTRETVETKSSQKKKELA